MTDKYNYAEQIASPATLKGLLIYYWSEHGCKREDPAQRSNCHVRLCFCDVIVYIRHADTADTS